MKRVSKMAMMATCAFIGASTSSADTLLTHRIPAALAVEAANETIAACARQGYHETAVVLDADGAAIVALRCAATVPASTRSIARTTRHTRAYPLKTTHSPWLNARKARTRLRRSQSCRMSCSLVAA